MLNVKSYRYFLFNCLGGIQIAVNKSFILNQIMQGRYQYHTNKYRYLKRHNIYQVPTRRYVQEVFPIWIRIRCPSGSVFKIRIWIQVKKQAFCRLYLTGTEYYTYGILSRAISLFPFLMHFFHVKCLKLIQTFLQFAALASFRPFTGTCKIK